jgi:hypothetical protein
MKRVIRYQSQLLFRKSYKPNRVLRFKPEKLNPRFRLARFSVPTSKIENQKSQILSVP